MNIKLYDSGHIDTKGNLRANRIILTLPGNKMAQEKHRTRFAPIIIPDNAEYEDAILYKGCITKE